MLLIVYSPLQLSILGVAKLHTEGLETVCSSRKHKPRRESHGRDSGTSSVQESYDGRALRVGALDKCVLCSVHQPRAELYGLLHLHSSRHWSPKPEKQRPEPGVMPSCCGQRSSEDTSLILSIMVTGQQSTSQPVTSPSAQPPVPDKRSPEAPLADSSLES